MDKPATPQKGPYKIKVEKFIFGVLVACPKNNHFVMEPIKKKENLNLLNSWLWKTKSLIFAGARCRADHLFVTAHIHGPNSKL